MAGRLMRLQTEDMVVGKGKVHGSDVCCYCSVKMEAFGRRRGRAMAFG